MTSAFPDIKTGENEKGNRQSYFLFSVHFVCPLWCASIHKRTHSHFMTFSCCLPVVHACAYNLNHNRRRTWMKVSFHWRKAKIEKGSDVRSIFTSSFLKNIYISHNLFIFGGKYFHFRLGVEFFRHFVHFVVAFMFSWLMGWLSVSCLGCIIASDSSTSFRSHTHSNIWLNRHWYTFLKKTFDSNTEMLIWNRPMNNMNGNGSRGGGEKMQGARRDEISVRNQLDTRKSHNLKCIEARPL